jgi:hypothetical protein
MTCMTHSEVHHSTSSNAFFDEIWGDKSGLSRIVYMNMNILNILYLTPQISNDLGTITVEFAVECYTNVRENLLFRVDWVTKKQSHFCMESEESTVSYFSTQKMLHVGVFPVVGGYNAFADSFATDADSFATADSFAAIDFSFYVKNDCVSRSIFLIQKTPSANKLVPYVFRVGT